MKAIVLTQGKIATVDDADFERVSQHNWFAVRRDRMYYAARSIRISRGVWGQEFLHQFILGVKGVDHKNGDGLDNQQGNLRRATDLQNARAFHKKRLGASSKFRGVSWDTKNKKWRAGIRGDGVVRNLGRYGDEVSAAHAYDEAARRYFGEFASPNFP